MSSGGGGEPPEEPREPPVTSFKEWWKRRSSRNLSERFRSVTFGQAKDDETAASSSSSGPSRRREQVHTAQRRHRTREAEYIEFLENEVQNLRESIRRTNLETAAYRQDEARLLATLRNHDALVRMRYDEDVHASRLFIERPPLTNPDVSAAARAPEASADIDQVELTYKALDFILSLEHVCAEHIDRPARLVAASAPSSPTGSMMGHVQTATSSVYAASAPEQSLSMYAADYPTTSASAPATTVATSPFFPSTATATAPSSRSALPDWHVPYSEIEKLVALSGRLDLARDEVTPAQAYQFLVEHGGFASLDDETVRTLKVELAALVQCYTGSFGAVLKMEDLIMVASSVLGTRFTFTNRGDSVAGPSTSRV